MFNIIEMIEAAEEKYYEEVSKIERAVREQLLIPFCDKHKISFDSGMGAWSLDNDLITIYGAQPNYWDVDKTALKNTKDDDEYEALTLKAKSFRELPETDELLKVLAAPTMRGVSIGSNIKSYVPGEIMDTSKVRCACEGTGLIPPTDKLSKGGHQAYCPTHKCKREWPQLQKDGSVKFRELRSDGQGLK